TPVAEPRARQLDVLAVDVRANEVAAQALGNDGGGAAAHKRIVNNAANWTSGQDHRLDQRLWEHGEVGERLRFGGHGPDGAAVARAVRIYLCLRACCLIAYNAVLCFSAIGESAKAW